MLREHGLEGLESVELSLQLVAGQQEASPVVGLKPLDRRLVRSV
jgi:hypothetical protein